MIVCWLLSAGVHRVLDVAVVRPTGVRVALERLVEAVEAGPDDVHPIERVDGETGVVAMEEVAVLPSASVTGGSE